MYDARASVFTQVLACLEETPEVCSDQPVENVKACINEVFPRACRADQGTYNGEPVDCGVVNASCSEVGVSECEVALSILGEEQRAAFFDCYFGGNPEPTTCRTDFFDCVGYPGELVEPETPAPNRCPQEPPSGSCSRYSPECHYETVNCMCIPMGPDLDAPANWRCDPV